MTPEDAFDARLKAAFARAEAETTVDEAMVERILRELRWGARRRTAVLAIAGAIGAAGALSQVEGLLAALPVEVTLAGDGALGDMAAQLPVAGLAAPSTLGAVLIGLIGWGLALALASERT